MKIMKYRVVKIINNITKEEVKLDNYRFWWVGKDHALAKMVGYGFDFAFAPYNCYTVITEEIKD